VRVRIFTCELQADSLRHQSCASGRHLARLTELELCKFAPYHHDLDSEYQRWWNPIPEGAVFSLLHIGKHDRCIATDWILEVKSEVNFARSLKRAIRHHVYDYVNLIVAKICNKSKGNRDIYVLTVANSEHEGPSRRWEHHQRDNVDRWCVPGCAVAATLILPLILLSTLSHNILSIFKELYYKTHRAN